MTSKREQLMYVVILVVVSVVVAAFFVLREDNDVFSRPVTLDITNTTSTPRKVTTPYQKLTLAPGSTQTVTVKTNDYVSTSDDRVLVSSPFLTHLYITPRGFRENEEHNDEARFHNLSSSPVHLVVLDRSGNRLVQATAAPGETALFHSHANSILEAHSAASVYRGVMDSVHVVNAPSNVVYNGRVLTAS